MVITTESPVIYGAYKHTTGKQIHPSTLPETNSDYLSLLDTSAYCVHKLVYLSDLYRLSWPLYRPLYLDYRLSKGI